MRDDRLPSFVRLVDDRLDLVERHLVLVDQLDDVDAGVGQLADFRARVLGTLSLPSGTARFPGTARAE